MKKNQVMAAIALAFALGVVAPISPAVFAEEGDAVAVVCDASNDTQLKNAIKNVTSNATYASYANLVEKLAYATSLTDVTAAMSGLTTTAGSFTGFSFSRGADLETMLNDIKSIKIEITNDSGTAVDQSWTKLAALAKAMIAAEDTPANNTVAADVRFNNLVDAMKALGYTNIETTLATAGYTTASVTNADFDLIASSPAGGVLGVIRSELNRAVTAGQITAPIALNLINLYKAEQTGKETLKGYTELRDAMLKLDPRTFGVSEYDDIEAAFADGSAAHLGNIADLQNYVNTYISTENSAWGNVLNRIAYLETVLDNFGSYSPNSICKSLDHEPTDDDSSEGLLQLLNEGFRLTGQSAWTYAQLVSDGTDEPGTDEPGTDEPGTDEPGTDEPGTEVPADPSKPSVDGIGGGSINSVGDGASFGTPDTGVVTKSEGSASASVAIMAAISTVVAGLGAAIVAIRNFKRNKNA